MSLPITNDGFSFRNKDCDSIFYTDINSKGEKIQLLRVRNKDSDIRFTVKETLCRKDDCSESDILMNFISIPFGDINSLELFFKSNGFLFNVGYDDYSLFICKDLFLISHRLQILIKLINELGDNNPDYIKLVKHTCYLLLVPPISLESNGDIIYRSATISNPDFNVYGMTSNLPFSSSQEDELGEDILYLDPYCTEKMLNAYYENSNYYEEPNYQVDFLRIVYPYLEYIDLKGTTILNTEEIDFKHEPDIIATARNIINKEMDYHLSKIRPTYNAESLEASWDIPDLITSLYFSILFLNPNFKIVKKCANPKCIEYFTVYESNNRKIYCSSRCANAISQKRFREK